MTMSSAVESHDSSSIPFSMCPLMLSSIPSAVIAIKIIIFITYRDIKHGFLIKCLSFLRSLIYLKVINAFIEMTAHCTEHTTIATLQIP